MLAFILYLTFLDSKKVLKLFFSLCFVYFAFRLNLLNSIKKCPECYGDELCRFFENDQIQLTWLSYFLLIINSDLTKSVYYGVFNGTEIVVKRKIRETRELSNFDDIKLNGDKAQSVILCPSVQDVTFLLHQVEDGIEKKRLWLDMSTSIEPLLLMYFQSQEIWPFPKYFGACGDLIVEEYKGVPLTKFLSSDFEKRIFLAINLLEIASLFTFGHSKLAFYFTDYSLDNFVVDSNGKIFLIDLDNVIISNKSAIVENYPSNMSTHTSEILDELKYAFSPSDICKHHMSDHNYFSICKYLLVHPDEGLLKDIPRNLNRYEELLQLLNECSVPSTMTDRFSAGKNLQFLLKEISHDYDKFRVFKKSSPNGKITLYLGKRDFIDHISFVDPIDGIVILADDYTENRIIYGQVVCSFRYGREEDEIMGLSFQKDLCLASGQIYPPLEQESLTRLQERLLKKLGPNAYPFTFKISPNAPTSVTLQPGSEDEGQPCGLHYYVKIFAGESECDRSHRRSTITFRIRKIQLASLKQGKQPCTIVRKDFMLSPGALELEMTLDKQLYHHGEKVAVSVCIRNNSNKFVKKIKAVIQQGVDIVLFQSGQYRSTVASVETQKGCPIQPGSCLQKVFYLLPSLEENKHRRGIALAGQLKEKERKLASSSLLASPDSKDMFGIIVSYTVKVKLFLGALGGEVVAELPMLLMES